MDRKPSDFEVRRSRRRLDRVIADELDCGRRAAGALIRGGCVLVDGRRAAPSQIVHVGQRITVQEPLPQVSQDAAFSQSPPVLNDIRIIHQSEDLVVLNKPSGIHSHHGKGACSAAAFMESRFGPGQNEIGPRGMEAGVAHRLDRDTSGILLAATNPDAYDNLRLAFREHRVQKHYLALVWGICPTELRCELPLARRPSRVVVARPHDRGLSARTDVKTLETGPDWSLVLASMSTGAPHQIRVHLAALGHPLVGDAVYGNAAPIGFPRQGHLLHAFRIQVEGLADMSCPAPRDFLKSFALLRSRT
jgi:23S rRNA pseudouridine1911/1915/1917 synthase